MSEGWKQSTAGSGARKRAGRTSGKRAGHHCFCVSDGSSYESLETGLPSLGKSKPESEDQLEGVVEWEPVNNGDQALKDAVIVR